MNMIENFTSISTNDNLSTQWQVYFEGVLRCNNTLKLLANDQAGPKEISAERAKEIQGEAKMLRAHYYFYLWRVFRNVPIITEEIATAEEAAKIPNDKDVLPLIEEDLKFAVENLPTTKINDEYGRMDKNAAKAYLGKLYLYQKKYAQALTLFKEVMAGKDLVSMPFWNNFDVTKENGPEGVVVSKHAINSNGDADNSNVGDMLSGLYGTSPVGCCGFYQPTIDLVNAYQVDANGLPLSPTAYRANPYLSDLENPSDGYVLKVDLKFDPRLDYTVGRRGVSYLDYGIMPGNAWIRDAKYAGPFVGIKTMIPQSQFASNAAPGANYLTGLDVNIIRLADVWLMAAECEVEVGSLANALKLVNDVRNRAANLAPKKTASGANAAAYNVKPYPSFANQDAARTAVRTERRLELAMEGHRFFDLVRWGVAKSVLESYSAFEGKYLPSYKGLVFGAKSEYWPIPQVEIDRSNGVLKPN
jgi:tetratricopeptide (TPR) repeat protein